ncbi:unnamed protein product, partial [Prorocentrum cordatum]
GPGSKAPPPGFKAPPPGPGGEGPGHAWSVGARPLPPQPGDDGHSALRGVGGVPPPAASGPSADGPAGAPVPAGPVLPPKPGCDGPSPSRATKAPPPPGPGGGKPGTLAASQHRNAGHAGDAVVSGRFDIAVKAMLARPQKPYSFSSLQPNLRGAAVPSPAATTTGAVQQQVEPRPPLPPVSSNAPATASRLTVKWFPLPVPHGDLRLCLQWDGDLESEQLQYASHLVEEIIGCDTSAVEEGEHADCHLEEYLMTPVMSAAPPRTSLYAGTCALGAANNINLRRSCARMALVLAIAARFREVGSAFQRSYPALANLLHEAEVVGVHAGL